jgi:hypothetical protein
MLQSVLEEIARARLPVRDDVFKRWQQEIQKFLAEPQLVSKKPKATEVSA